MYKYDRICSTYVRIYVHMYEYGGLYMYIYDIHALYIHMYMYIQ